MRPRLGVADWLGCILASECGFFLELFDDRLFVEAKGPGIGAQKRQRVSSSRQHFDVHFLKRFEEFTADPNPIGDLGDAQAQLLARLRQLSSRAPRRIQLRRNHWRLPALGASPSGGAALLVNPCDPAYAFCAATF